MSHHQHPPLVTHLHYELDGWLGDELLESFPCFVVTAQLAEVLRSSCLSGFRLSDVEISTSIQFQELYPDRELPEFYWLEITGTAGEDDFGTEADGRLVASESALATLRTLNISQCEIEERLASG